MNPSNVKTLLAHKHHYESLISPAQIVKDISIDARKALRDLARQEFDSNFHVDVFCTGCLPDLLQFVYGTAIQRGILIYGENGTLREPDGIDFPIPERLVDPALDLAEPATIISTEQPKEDTPDAGAVKKEEPVSSEKQVPPAKGNKKTKNK